jgi:hypothetical protein
MSESVKEEEKNQKKKMRILRFTPGEGTPVPEIPNEHVEWDWMESRFRPQLPTVWFAGPSTSNR